MTEESPGRRCALTAPFHPYRHKAGGISLLHLSWSRLHQPLTGILLCGARTFLMPYGTRLFICLNYVIVLQLDQKTTAAFAFYRLAAAHIANDSRGKRHTAAAALIAAELRQRRHAVLLNGLVFLHIGVFNTDRLLRYNCAQLLQFLFIFGVFYVVFRLQFVIIGRWNPCGCGVPPAHNQQLSA